MSFLRNRNLLFNVSIMNKTEEDYYELMQKAQREKDLRKKIALYERNLKILPPFVSSCLSQDGELPPLIPCRDELPILYMRLGDWKKAERVIKQCMKCNAYYPDNGNEELQYLLRYQTVAEVAVEYIRRNPGVLQKDLYKALKDEKIDRECLKSFTRFSMTIKKIKKNNTNELYIK